MFSPSLHPWRTSLMAFAVLLAALSLASCTGTRPRHSKGLVPFASDGCSLFPDGTLNNRKLWCDCCLQHDLAYWQGGSADERSQADVRLRDCVLARTGDPQLAETMYLGARGGGHPAFPTWYRWGYGWPYGRGYAPLSELERLQVRERLAAYRRGPAGGYCAE